MIVLWYVNSTVLFHPITPIIIGFNLTMIISECLSYALINKPGCFYPRVSPFLLFPIGEFFIIRVMHVSRFSHAMSIPIVDSPVTWCSHGNDFPLKRPGDESMCSPILELQPVCPVQVYSDNVATADGEEGFGAFPAAFPTVFSC